MLLLLLVQGVTTVEPVVVMLLLLLVQLLLSKCPATTIVTAPTSGCIATTSDCPAVADSDRCNAVAAAAAAANYDGPATGTTTYRCNDS